MPARDYTSAPSVQASVRPTTDDGLQLWWVRDRDLPVVCSAVAPWLSPLEWRRADACLRPGDRGRFIARRGWLRQVLAGEAGCQPDQLAFSTDVRGRPVLVRPPGNDLVFSVSHTHGATLVAVGHGVRLGVDVQACAEVADPFLAAEEVFSHTELQVLRCADAAEQLRRFFATWARKEALLKAWGIGLVDRPRAWNTGTSAEPGRWWAAHDGVALAGWTLLDLEIGHAWAAALAVQLPDVSIVLRDARTACGPALPSSSVPSESN